MAATTRQHTPIEGDGIELRMQEIGGEVTVAFVHLPAEVLGFDFDSAWDASVGVTTAQLPPERQEEAKAALCEVMWPDRAASRSFRNTVQHIVGRRPGSGRT
jgi:hypothetical protein